MTNLQEQFKTYTPDQLVEAHQEYSNLGNMNSFVAEAEMIRRLNTPSSADNMEFYAYDEDEHTIDTYVELAKGLTDLQVFCHYFVAFREPAYLNVRKYQIERDVFQDELTTRLQNAWNHTTPIDGHATHTGGKREMTNELTFENYGPRNLLTAYEAFVIGGNNLSFSAESEIMHRLNPDNDSFRNATLVTRYDKCITSPDQYADQVREMNDVALFHHYRHAARDHVNNKSEDMQIEFNTLRQELLKRLEHEWTQDALQEEGFDTDYATLRTSLGNIKTGQLEVVEEDAGAFALADHPMTKKWIGSLVKYSNKELLTTHNELIQSNSPTAELSATEIIQRMSEAPAVDLDTMSIQELVELNDYHRSMSREIKRIILNKLEEN